MKKWTTYKRRLLELQDTLNRNPIQDAFIALEIEILLALLEDKRKIKSKKQAKLNLLLMMSFRHILNYRVILGYWRGENEQQKQSKDKGC